MLAKVSAFHWCSDAAKLHDNELSSYFFTPQRFVEYHLHEDKKNHSRVTVSSKVIVRQE